MSHTQQTDEIETALEACDGVRTAPVLADDPLRVEVFFQEDSSGPAPIADVLGEYELRIWSVNFDWRSVSLVHAKELDYPELGGSGQ